MSYSRYLTAINTILRNTVLPEVQSGRAKDAVNNSMKVLAALAGNLERVSPDVLASLNAATLPDNLKTLAPTSDPAQGITLPLNGPPDDLALNSEGFDMLKAGSEWLAKQPWPNDKAMYKSAVALLSWETAMRQDVIARADKSERGFAVQSAGDSIEGLTQANLEKYLRKRLGSDAIRVTEFRFLSGGRNRQTALFAIEGTQEIPARLVVQRDPPVAMTTFRGVGMQFKVMQQAHTSGMKVARPVMFEMAIEPLGGPFMIIEQVGGASPIPSMDYWSPPLKSDRLAASLAEQFALMHKIPLDKLEGEMDRYVDTAKGQTWLGDIETLEQQLQGLLFAPSMAVTASLAWLRAHIACVDGVESVVHNDALLQNVLAENEEITAVLDWEMAHIGHPFEDLGYVRPVVEQMTDWSRFVDAYVAAGGRQPTQEQIDFFTLRSILKLMVQVLYVRGAFSSGKADVPELAEIGAAFLPKLIDRLANQLNTILKS